MTDAELNALEKTANIAKGRSNEKDFFGMNSELVIFYAMASPEAILELIAELRQARKERDWLAVQVVRYKTDCPMNREWEKCNDGQYENRDEPKNNQRCIKCWLEAAKEAVCQK